MIDSQADKEPAVSIEEMPIPEGGIDAFKSWINDNTRYKQISDTVTEKYKVYVQFTMPISFTEKASESIKAIEERNKSLILKTNEELFNKGNLAFADKVFARYYRDRGPEYTKDYVRALKKLSRTCGLMYSLLLPKETW